MTARDRLLAVFLSQGSAIAGKPLTHAEMLERFKDPAFRAAFNRGAPVVEYPDAETAALASRFEEAAVCGEESE
jgi:hypothetical protein